LPRLLRMDSSKVGVPQPAVTGRKRPMDRGPRRPAADLGQCEFQIGDGLLVTAQLRQDLPPCLAKGGDVGGDSEGLTAHIQGPFPIRRFLMGQHERQVVERDRGARIDGIGLIEMANRRFHVAPAGFQRPEREVNHRRSFSVGEGLLKLDLGLLGGRTLVSGDLHDPLESELLIGRHSQWT